MNLAIPGTSYSVIGGGAAPFNPIAWDFSSQSNSSPLMQLPPNYLLSGCMKQVHKNSNRRPSNIVSHYKDCCSTGRNSGILNRRSLPPLAANNELSTNNDRSGKLYCRTGFHLQIHQNGRVNGTRQDNSRFGILEFLSIAFGLVSIRGKETNRYLCMNKSGKLYGSLTHTTDCIFMERMLENYYNTYTSCQYSRRNRRWFVALNKRGKPRRGNRSKKKQKFSQFLVLHLDLGGQRRLHQHNFHKASPSNHGHHRHPNHKRVYNKQHRLPTEQLIKLWHTSTSGSSNVGHQQPTHFDWLKRKVGRGAKMRGRE